MAIQIERRDGAQIEASDSSECLIEVKTEVHSENKPKHKEVVNYERAKMMESYGTEYHENLEKRLDKLDRRLDKYHEKSEKYYDKLKSKYKKHSEDKMAEEFAHMSNYYAGGMGGYGGGMGGGYGGGYCGDGFGGGGLLGALVVASLFGRGGFGRDGFDGHHGGHHDGCCGSRCATPDDVMDVQQLGVLSDIKAEIPLAEAQTQLAIAQAQYALSNQTTEQTLALTAGQTAIQLAQANTLFQLSQQLCATENNLSNITHNEGEKTRALITNNQIMELNRLAAERQDEIIELRNERRRDVDRHGIEISMINNQNQNQLQAQAQFQAQALFNERIFKELCDVSQIAKATNAQINIGSGTLTGAAQTANPINTKI